MLINNKIDLPTKPVHGRARFLNYAIGRQFDVQARDDVTDITIYDIIGEDPWTGEGVSAKKMRMELDNVKTGQINLYINSPGGDVFDGIAIYNDLKDHPAKVNVHIKALAASAASVIAMAGDTITMADNAMIMIHNAWVFALGDKNDLRDVADLLDKIDVQLIKTYAARTGQSRTDIAAMMNAESWLDAKEAVELGFADSFEDHDDSASAAYDIGVFANTPSKLKQRIEATLRDAGYSRREAKAALSEGFHILGQRDAGGNQPARRDAGDGYQTLIDAVNRITQSIAA